MGKRKLGTCYETAFNFLVNPHPGWEGCIMVHGRPTLTVPPYCQYGHAWIEKDGMCFDTETKSVWPRKWYYFAGKISESGNITYTREEACTLALSHRHYGPWHGPEACGPLTKRRRTRSRLTKIQETTP